MRFGIGYIASASDVLFDVQESISYVGMQLSEGSEKTVKQGGKVVKEFYTGREHMRIL